MVRMPTAAVLCFLLTSPMTAQVDQGRRVNLSGTWVMDPERSESAQATDETQVRSATVVIRHTPANIHVDTVRNGVREFARYPIAGTEQPKAVGTSGSIGTIVEWDGQAMVTITPLEVNGMTVTMAERRFLSADGREMTVMRSLTVQHGYQGNGRNFSPQSTDIYVRQSE